MSDTTIDYKPAEASSTPNGLNRLAGRVSGLWLGLDWPMRLVLVLGVMLLVAALAAPLIAPYEPNAQSLLARLKPPIGFAGAREGHVFGTD